MSWSDSSINSSRPFTMPQINSISQSTRDVQYQDVPHSNIYSTFYISFCMTSESTATGHWVFRNLCTDWLIRYISRSNPTDIPRLAQLPWFTHKSGTIIYITYSTSIVWMDRLQDHDKTIHCNVFIQHRLNNSITAHRFSLHGSLLSPSLSYCHTTQFESHPYARHLNATTSTVRRDTLSMDCSKNYRIMIQVIADDILWEN